MVDFDLMVKSILWEMNTVGISPGVQATSTGTQNVATNQSSNTSTVPNEPQGNDKKEIEEISRNLEQFLEEQYTNLQQLFTTTVYKEYFESKLGTFPNKPEFQKIVYTAANNSLRDVLDPEAYDDLPSIFPLLELISKCKFTYKQAKGSDNAKIQLLKDVYDKFVMSLKSGSKNGKAMPLEFFATDPWAVGVRKKYFEKKGKIDTGALKIESLKDKNIYVAILTLLEHRRKSRIRLFPQATIGSAKSSIDNILKNPDKYIQGKIIYPDKKIDLIYTGVTSDLLLSVAKNCHLLFDQQLREKNVSFTDDITKQKTFDLFMQGKVDQFDKTQQSAAPLSPSSGYSESFNSLFKLILSEETDKVPNEEIDDSVQLTFIDGKFLISDIIKNAPKNLEAKNLLNALTQLANFIKKESDGINLGQILQAATQIVKGMSLGVKNMGT